MDSARVLGTVATLHRQLIASSGLPSTGRDADSDAACAGLLDALVGALDLAGAALVLASADGPRVVAVPETLAATEPAQPPAPGADVVRERGRLAVALRLEPEQPEEPVGSLVLYADEGRTWSQADVDDVTSLAAVLAAVLVAARRLGEREATVAQLQSALDSRVIIEQAKGIVAARHGVGVEEAFELVRTHARSRHVTVRAVAEAIVHLGLQLGDAHEPPQPGEPGEPGEPGVAGPAPG
jgi:GAF domain-containing protein